MRKFSFWVFLFVFMFLAGGTASSDSTLPEARLLRFPDISHGKIVFVYGSDLWTVSDKGGVATQLTSHKGREMFPKFSPDGKQIAFSGQYDGYTQVYVMPADGGIPKQLTYHPGYSQVVSWHPDGKSVYFLSYRGVYLPFTKLYKAELTGGLAEDTGLPESGLVSFSADGAKIAYNRYYINSATWKRYKGGKSQDVWLYDFKGNTIKQLTTYKGNDTFPMWHGDRVYFVSDNNKQVRMNIYYYDLKTDKITQVTDFSDYDINWASLGDEKIVFEKGGFLYTLTLDNHHTEKLTIYLYGANYKVLPKWVDASKSIDSFGLSPQGERAVFCGRGEIFTVGAKRNDVVNLTKTDSARERYPVWSPDGRWIAYTSDQTGEYEIYIRPANEFGEGRQITSGTKCFINNLVWSPDSTKLVYSNSNNELYYIDVNEKKPVFVNKSKSGIGSYSWSPDSKWIAYYQMNGKTHKSWIFAYSLVGAKSFKVTNGFYFNWNPVFSPDGKYLYFLSRRNFNAIGADFDFDIAYINSTGIYFVPLRKDLKSPFELPEDRVMIKSEKKIEKPAKTEKTVKTQEKTALTIDFEGITKRVLRVPVSAGNIRSLMVHGDKIFYFAYPAGGRMGHGGVPASPAQLHVIDISKRKDSVILSGISDYELSSDGKTILFKKGSKYGFTNIANPDKQTAIDLSGMKMEVDPQKERQQIYFEAWRMERDYFYSPVMNGVDWAKVKDQYAVLLPYVVTDEDFVYLIGEMIGELGNSHTYVSNRKIWRTKKVNVGLLGVDFGLDKKSGVYYFKKIYGGKQWKNVSSPLAAAGLNVKEGDYLLAVNGRSLKYPVDPYRLLQNTAGKEVLLTINGQPSLSGSREVRVKTLTSEYSLRHLTWITDNREKVKQLSNGSIGYIYLPNMGIDGLAAFMEGFFPQLGKKGLVIDVRHNGGGFVSQLIIERLRRVIAGMKIDRTGEISTYPSFAFNGYLVCVSDSYSASDGDLFTYFFKQYQLGPVIGTRTWGGVRGIRGAKEFLDGSQITCPSMTFYGMNSQWIIENYGVEPDIELDNRPDLMVKGQDPQLEKAVEVLLEKIKKQPKKLPKPPPYLPAFPPEGL